MAPGDKGVRELPHQVCNRVLKIPVPRPAIAKSMAQGAKRKELTDKTTTDSGPQKPVSRRQQRAKSRAQRDNGLMTA